MAAAAAVHPRRSGPGRTWTVFARDWAVERRYGLCRRPDLSRHPEHRRYCIWFGVSPAFWVQPGQLLVFSVARRIPTLGQLVVDGEHRVFGGSDGCEPESGRRVLIARYGHAVSNTAIGKSARSGPTGSVESS